jgi:ketosteroid isomerase-like protein
MTSLLRIAILAAGAALLAVAADPKAAVEQAERGWAAASVKADLPALEKLLAADLVYTHSGGARDTRSSFIDSARTGKLKYEKLEHQKIEVQMVKSDVAFVAARADVRVISAGKPVDMKVSLLHVWVKRQGRWQLVAHQSARLP